MCCCLSAGTGKDFPVGNNLHFSPGDNLGQWAMGSVPATAQTLLLGLGSKAITCLQLHTRSVVIFCPPSHTITARLPRFHALFHPLLLIFFFPVQMFCRSG